MTFDDVQTIWNSQGTPDGALSNDDLFQVVTERDRSFRRIVNLTDILMTLTLLFVAMMFFRDPVLQGHDMVLIVPGVACLIAAGFVWSWRIHRQRRQIDFDDSLLGLINKSIDGINDRIAQMSNFMWWFACPNILGLAIALFIIDDSKRYLLYMIFIPAFFLCIGLAFWQIQREIRLKLEPEKKRLESLRSQFSNAD